MSDVMEEENARLDLVVDVLLKSLEDMKTVVEILQQRPKSVPPPPNGITPKPPPKAKKGGKRRSQTPAQHGVAEVIVVQTDVDGVSVLCDKERLRARVAAISAERLAFQPDGHDQWPLPGPEPIVVHGVEIWPTNDRYEWKAAYYAFNLWQVLERMGAASKTRAHQYQNPIGPILYHVNGQVGIVIQKIANAMLEHPNDAENTRGPGKVLQGR